MYAPACPIQRLAELQAPGSVKLWFMAGSDWQAAGGV